MSKLKTVKYLSILLIIISWCTSVGCGEYRTYAIEKGVGHFSIEYPSNYRVTQVELREDNGYSNITIDGPSKVRTGSDNRDI